MLSNTQIILCFRLSFVGLQSSSPLTPRALDIDIKRQIGRAKDVAHHANCSSLNMMEMVECLRRADPHDILKAQNKVGAYTTFNLSSKMLEECKSLTIFNDVPLRARRALMPYTLYSNSVLLVLNS